MQNTITIERKYLNAKEAAAYMRLHPNTVYQLVNQGRLTCVRAGNRIRFTVEDLERFLRGPGLSERR